jgi:hypothetical protein
MRFILVYLPFEPFVILYSLLQQLIQVDVANTEVLDREDVDVYPAVARAHMQFSSVQLSGHAR